MSDLQPTKSPFSKPENWTTWIATAGVALAQLNELKNGLLVADELAIEIDGFTDNTGDPNGNLSLSDRRAHAVQNWLAAQSHSSFPADRFSVVRGFGSENAIASNDSETGRAKNRRVTIVLGTTN